MVLYKCEKCGTQYTNKSQYNRHLNKKKTCNNIENENEDEINNIKKHKFGQYFTKNIELKEKLYEFIFNNPDTILEPSIGRGDLIKHVLEKSNNILFDMFEIDEDIDILDGIEKEKIIYGDFLEQNIIKKYKTIIGNPPYVRTIKGNLYIDFTEKCYNLLDEDGELIFIVPSDFFKLTSSSRLLNNMMNNGTFTHIYHPNNERMFEDAAIDIIIFRYCKNILLIKKVIYNNNELFIKNSDGLITFHEENNYNDDDNNVMFKDYFDITKFCSTIVYLIYNQDGVHIILSY